MAECNNCGKCCFIPTGKVMENGDRELKPCRYLVRVSKDKFICRIYNQRLGTEIARVGNQVYYCLMYNDMHKEIKGCPLNLGVKEQEIIQIKNAKRAYLKAKDGRDKGILGEPGKENEVS